MISEISEISEYGKMLDKKWSKCHYILAQYKSALIPKLSERELQPLLDIIETPNLERHLFGECEFDDMLKVMLCLQTMVSRRLKTTSEIDEKQKRIEQFNQERARLSRIEHMKSKIIDLTGDIYQLRLKKRNMQKSSELSESSINDQKIAFKESIMGDMSLKSAKREFKQSRIVDMKKKPERNLFEDDDQPWQRIPDLIEKVSSSVILKQSQNGELEIQNQCYQSGGEEINKKRKKSEKSIKNDPEESLQNCEIKYRQSKKDKKIYLRMQEEKHEPKLKSKLIKLRQQPALESNVICDFKSGKSSQLETEGTVIGSPAKSISARFKKNLLKSK